MPAFEIGIDFPLDYYRQNFTHRSELVYASTMETEALILTKYYSIALICGIHNAIKINYHKCGQIEQLDFGKIAVG